MAKTTTHKRRGKSVESRFAQARLVLSGLHRAIDKQIEQARDLEVRHAQALFRAGKATLHDADDIIRQARQRIG